MSDLFIRNANMDDYDEIVSIYARARKFMAETGNPNQWKNKTPTPEVTREDIELSRLYVCMSEEGIECVFMYSEEADPTYSLIVDGGWPNEKPYGVLHRIASAGRRSGVSGVCFDWCFDRCKNLRADTHKDNKIMQKAMMKNGFKYCGIIYIADGSERLAFQRTE